MNAWREITVRARQPKRKPLFTCDWCGKGRSNPLGHVCARGGDFARRTRQQDWAKDAAAARKVTRDKVTAARQSEPAKDCERPVCLAWRDGPAEGRDLGFEDGFTAGTAAAAKG